MRITGIVLVALGILWGIVAFNLEVTVSGAAFTATRIYNNGLLEERRIHLSIAEALALAGVILIGFGTLNKKMEAK